MTISEKIAHLKGLAEGLGITEEKSKESRMLNAMLEILEDMSAAIADLEDCNDLVNEELDDIADELIALEEDFYGDEEDEDDDDVYDFDDDDDEIDDIDDLEEDDTCYLVECPSCGEEIAIDEDTLLTSEIRCTSCGQLFSLEIVGQEGDVDDDEDLVDMDAPEA